MLLEAPCVPDFFVLLPLSPSSSTDDSGKEQEGSLLCNSCLNLFNLFSLSNAVFSFLGGAIAVSKMRLTPCHAENLKISLRDQETRRSTDAFKFEKREQNTEDDKLPGGHRWPKLMGFAVLVTFAHVYEPCLHAIVVSILVVVIAA